MKIESFNAAMFSFTLFFYFCAIRDIREYAPVLYAIIASVCLFMGLVF